MKENDLSEIESCLSQLTQGVLPNDLESVSGDSTIAHIKQLLNTLVEQCRRIESFLLPLARGEVGVKAPKGVMLFLGPLKQLQANLFHLSWQAQQVAKGDYTQRVHFMGDFSVAFNAMVESLSATVSRLADSEEKYKELASTDALTGIANRRSFLDSLEEEVRRARQHNRKLSVLSMDLDHFKSVNDTYGHAAGDAVIREFTVVCRDVLRQEDTLGRLGGEEFTALLPTSDMSGAKLVADRVLSAVRTTPVQVNSAELHITVSIGMAELKEEELVEGLLARADEALYKAKREGRDRAEIAE